MTSRGFIGAFLFGSGFCSLVYQTVWMREFRLIFGASTAASAAVLAIFIGGLGLGSSLLGERAERQSRPLAFYGFLEIVVALSAAASPLLLAGVRKLYLLLGGSAVLGGPLSTLLRLLLSALVLGLPTVAMGGTLPAVARTLTAPDDPRRGGFALAYAANTLGAVAGCSLTTFLLLEHLGNRATLGLAALLNLSVGLAARFLAREAPLPSPDLSPDVPPPAPLPAPRPLVLTAAAIVGFVFFLMELVWYRMLGPILGGSVFTFGTILAVALLGVGAGSFAYAFLGGDRRPSLAGFAFTCLLEALVLAVPFALGDRLAVLAIVLRPLGVLGFAGHVAAWIALTSFVVLPAALISGVQFPLLVGLLGSGQKGVGSDTGKAYAWNTAGAIAGSLAGGFGLLPLLGALGCWKLVVAALVLLGVVALVVGLAQGGSRGSLTLVSVAAGALALLRAEGPTAVWRHSPIGAGRVSPEVVRSPAQLRAWQNHQRRSVRQEFEGRESSLGLDISSGLSFVVNGKIDGNAIYDGPTQVMLGLVGAALHPAPRRSLVIGLGTGSTAGWLAALPVSERVDVAELEPAMLQVAEECAPVNHDALSNPKLQVLLGDARELATAGSDRYDLVTSEPSNPYRAGIASLFTQDFYRIVAGRLAPGGLFLQWVQAYEIDAHTIRTLYATFRSVFPRVETWQLRDGDLLLIGSFHSIEYRADVLRQRLAEEPFRSALLHTWRVDDLEGFLAHHVARPSFADAVVASFQGPLNTDDRCVVEFGFARGIVASTRSVEFQDLRAAADVRGEQRPAIVGDVDWEHVEDIRVGLPVVESYAPTLSASLPPERYRRGLAYKGYIDGDMKAVLDAWKEQPKPPRSPLEIEALAGAFADHGREQEALPLLERLWNFHTADADGILAWLRYRQDRMNEAVEALERAFAAHRKDPFVSPIVLQRALALAEDIGSRDQGRARRLFDALREPFVLYALDGARLQARRKLAHALGDMSCVEAFRAYEPHVPWDLETLTERVTCYRRYAPEKAPEAERDLALLRHDEPTQVLPR
ncbi:MAG: fused MFS/spermidine synthase [Myxococcales bacterium]|nr:fused MFS/spermidine synthase [Polyangiaceae bacterium]MDW8248210.1 fused MFS/spermidine synthase [Myxococcales bacterium]